MSWNTDSKDLLSLIILEKITPALVTKLTEEKNLEFNDLNTYFKTKHNNYKISHTLMAISEAILMKDSEKKCLPIQTLCEFYNWFFNNNFNV